MADRWMAVVGSSRMSQYGARAIEKVVAVLTGRGYKIICLDLSGCGRYVKNVAHGRVEVIDIRKGDFEEAHERIANKAEGLVVIEGGKSSGTMLVALAFLEKGKPVWAVPGRIEDEESYTPNWLIRNGARPFLGEEEDLDILA